MAREEMDDIQAMEAKDTARRLPWGWVVLFWGLIIWGVYYAWAYTPPRWSQGAAYDQAADAAGAVATSGSSIFATVFFTAAATTAAVLLLVMVSRKRTGKGG